MISSVHQYPVSNYFNPDSNQKYFIPKYQREYVWKKENWASLFDDLEESQAGYFLGSIICVNKQADALQANELELIDGQQRFTTICLLLCAMYCKLKTIVVTGDELKNEIYNLKFRLFVKPAAGTSRRFIEPRFTPSEQGKNRLDYNYVLSDLFPEVPKPVAIANYGNRRISKAYSFFCNRLESYDCNKTLDLLEKLKSAILVKIEVPSHADAFVLFETINDRGIALSAIDIIKNNLLAELDKSRTYGIDRAFDEWKDLIELLPDSSIQERFLRQLYNAFKYSKKVLVKNCPRATKSNLIAIYDDLLKKRPIRVFKELQKQGRIYAALINNDLAEEVWNGEVSLALRDLQRLGAAPSYTLLLWTVQVCSDMKWDKPSLIARLSTLLMKWYFWRNLTDIPATRELDPIFEDLILSLLNSLKEGHIRNADDFIDEISLSLSKSVASDEIKKQKLTSDIYQDNYNATRFLLCKIEEAHQTIESNKDLWAIGKKDKPLFTVEHILPKTENLTPGWIIMLGGTDVDAVQNANTVREAFAHQLGNLTLSGYNSALGKMNFTDKRDRVDDKGDYIGYKNGFYLNTELSSADVWNKNTIKGRTKSLTEEVISLFRLS